MHPVRSLVEPRQATPILPSPADTSAQPRRAGWPGEPRFGGAHLAPENEKTLKQNKDSLLFFLFFFDLFFMIVHASSPRRRPARQIGFSLFFPFFKIPLLFFFFCSSSLLFPLFFML